MLNIEFYKNDIQRLGTAYFSCINGKIGECDTDRCKKCIIGGKNHDCVYNRLEWLAQEYKKPILDDIEKEYLSAVIKPFRKRIKSIKKTGYPSNSAFISIAMDKCEHIFLPVFELNSGMYQRMEISKEYTLKDLGL